MAKGADPTGKSDATLLEELEARKKKNEGQEHVNNSKEPAGSPMYFYCPDCDDPIIVPEGYTDRPTHCPGCTELRRRGLIK